MFERCVLALIYLCEKRVYSKFLLSLDPASLLRSSESVLSTPVVQVGTMEGIHEKAGYESSLLFGKYMCQNLG